MKKRWARLGGWMLVALMVSDGQAQGTEVGAVDKIAVQKGQLVSSVKFRDAEIARSAGRQLVSLESALFMRDIVRLHRDITVHMRFAQGGNRSEVFMRPGASSSQGDYEIREDAIDPLSSFQLVVKLGTMVVERKSGKFVAFLLGKRVEVPGSIVLFEVSERDAVGRVYLQEGHIRFPECDIDASGRDLAWNLRKQDCPTPWEMSRDEIQRWRDEVKYATDVVWSRSRPFYKKPGFLIPVGVAILGGAIYLLTSDGNDGVRGSVRIPIPN